LIIIRGKFCDRGTQTDPVNPFKLAAGLKGGASDMDKFKKFFFATYYSFMMMNSIMADSLKK
jgi:hypothetical protein